jgi:hypothetical protein
MTDFSDRNAVGGSVADWLRSVSADCKIWVRSIIKCGHMMSTFSVFADCRIHYLQIMCRWKILRNTRKRLAKASCQVRTLYDEPCVHLLCYCCCCCWTVAVCCLDHF